MAYTRFTYQRVKKELGLAIHYQELFSDVASVQPSAWLLETLERGKRAAYFSEKSRSEAIVFPILTEIQQISPQPIVIYSGAELNIDDKKDLNGECDYLMGKGEDLLSLDTPIFCVLKAKDNDIEKALPQCIAQMEATRLFNEQQENTIATIYGCCTTGSEWLFLKLEHPHIYVDVNRYAIKNLGELLAVLLGITA